MNSRSLDHVFTRPTEDHKGQSVRSGVVSLTSQGVRFAERNASMMIMARLLAPENFGLQGMVVALTGFLSLFRDAGLSTVTVQRELITHEQVSTLFWLNLAVGVVLAAALIVLAPAIALFYGDPRLTAIATVSAITFIANGASVQHYALLQRQMRFIALGAIEVAALLIST